MGVDTRSSSIGPPTADKSKAKWNWQYLEAVLLCVLIVGVWSLFSLPIIFYHLPGLEVSSNSSSNTSCSAPLQYATTSGICLTEFSNILSSSNCPLSPEGNVLVLRNEEATAARVINGLAVVGASFECRSKAIPFFCQHIFGLCSGSGVSIQPTSIQCEEISNGVCQQEWLLIKRLNIDVPDCAMFPPEASSCPPLNDSVSTNETTASGIERFLNETSVTLLECSEGFYQVNHSGVCTPSCHTWMQYNKGVSIFLDVSTIILALIGTLAALAVIIISCLSRKRMFNLPSIFIVYIMIDALVLGLLTLVSFTDNKQLFCSSRNLIESSMVVTPYCVTSGIIPLYVYFQSTLWWLYHIAFIFWNIVFPLDARSFGRVKNIHIACVLVGIILPLVPVITSVADFAVDIQEQNENSSFQFRKNLFFSKGLGFEPTRYPTIRCSSTNQDANFYSNILPSDIMLGSGCTMLVIMVCYIHRLYRRKKVQPNIKFKMFKFGTAEKKLLAVLLYYLVLSITGLTAYIFSARDSSQLIDRIPTYFFCEQGGHNASSPCSHSEIENQGSPSLEFVSKFLVAMFPVVNLVYVVNIQELKELRKKWLKRLKNSS